MPMVTGIAVDEQNDTISVTGTGFNQITWVSNGQVIARGMENTAIDLDNLSGQVGCYVRFYITGPGGICYSQPFVVNVDGECSKRPGLHLEVLPGAARFVLPAALAARAKTPAAVEA